MITSSEHSSNRINQVKTATRFVLRVVVACICLSVVYSRVDITAPFKAMMAVDRLLWPKLVALYLLNTAVYTGRLVVLQKEAVPFFRACGAVLVGNFFGLVLPTGGGEAAKVVMLGPILGSRECALALIVASRMVELVVWAGLVLWAAVGVLPGVCDQLLPVAWMAGFAFLGIATIGLVGSQQRWQARFSPIVSKLPLIGPFFDRSWSRYRLLSPTKSGLIKCFALSFVFAAVNCCAAWVAFRAFSAAISYPETLGLVPTMDVIISLPITISGVGMREWVFSEVLPSWGVAPAVALAIGYARFSGHLGRALIGGVLYALGLIRPNQ